MAFPAEVQTVTVNMGPVLTAGGEPVVGAALQATLTTQVLVLSDGAILPSTVFVRTGSDGRASLTLAATDSVGLDTTGFTYAITAYGVTKDVALPAAAPVVDVEDLVEVEASDGTVVWLPPTGWVQDADLATVATTGAYGDLTGKPTLGTAAATAASDYATAEQGAKANAAQPAATLDADVASLVSAGALRSALAAGFAERARLGMIGERDQIAPGLLTRKAAHPQTISLITGSEDEVLGASQCAIMRDTTNARVGAAGWKMTTAGAVTNAYALLSPVPPSSSGPATIRPAQAVCLWVYIEDAAKVTNIQVEVTQDAANSISWLRANVASPVQTLSTGWNLLRWKLCEGLPATFTGTTINRCRVFTTTNAATSITVGHLYLETPARARMIFIADRGYRSFVINGLPDLRALRVPVTWAVDVLKLGDSAGQFPDGPLAYAEAVTEAEIANFAAIGDSISFHGFTSDPTASMTAEQIRSDTVRCIKWLQARGYEGRMWRAAWVQNQAANHAAADPYVLGQATWDVATHSVALDIWPPRDIQNIARWDFYTKSLTQCNAQFDILKRTHGLMVVYNHGVGTGYAQDATQEQWDNFVANVQTGIAQGWLEATTFEALWAESGGEFHTISGANVATYVDRTGDRLAKALL